MAILIDDADDDEWIPRWWEAAATAAAAWCSGGDCLLRISSSFIIFVDLLAITGQNADLLSTAGKCPEKGTR